MDDVIVGLLSTLVGLVLCFRGYLAMRVVIPIWGAFVGFFAGVGLVAASTGDGAFSGALPWVAGIALALLFGFLAYAYYAVSVIVSLAGIGFVLGASLMVGLGIGWTWIIVAVGVLCGAALGWLAISVDLPMVILIVLTSLGGASAVVGGLMVLTGALETSDFDRADVVARMDASPLWWLAYVALAVLGFLAQTRTLGSARTDLRRRFDG